MFVRDLRHFLDIDDVAGRIADGFEEYGLGLGVDVHELELPQQVIAQRLFRAIRVLDRRWWLRALGGLGRPRFLSVLPSLFPGRSRIREFLG